MRTDRVRTAVPGQESGWRSASRLRSRAGSRSPMSSARRSSCARRVRRSRACARSTAKDAELRRHARAGHLALLRLSEARRHLHVRDGAGRADVPRGPARPRGTRRRRARRPGQPRRSPARPAARRRRACRRLLSRGPDRDEDRRTRPGVPPGSWLHRRHHREAPAGLCTGRLGPAGRPARRQARRQRGRAHRGRAREAAPARQRRVDFFRERVLFPIRDANGHAIGLGGRIVPGRGRECRAQVPAHGRDAAVREEPHALPHRPREVAIRKTGQAVIVEGSRTP